MNNESRTTEKFMDYMNKMREEAFHERELMMEKMESVRRGSIFVDKVAKVLSCVPSGQ